MSIADNKALVRRFYEEVWNRGNLAAADDIFRDDYVRHDLRPGNALPARRDKRRSRATFGRLSLI